MVNLSDSLIDTTEEGMASHRRLVVETVAGLEVEGGYLALALDEQGQAHVAYWENFQTAQGRLRYAVRSSRGWHVETVAATLGAQVAIALDGGGRPLLAYLDLATAELKIARQSDDGWGVETAAAGLNSFAPGALCLALVGDGQPDITYFDEDRLKLARLTAGGWELLTVDEAPGSGYYHDAAVTGDGDLLIASANLISQSVRLWRVAAGSRPVLEEEVKVSPGSFDYLSLAIDDGGRPHLCYVTSGGLTHAFQGDEGWVEEPVKAGAGVGLYARLRANGSRLKVAHYDADNGRLLIARRENGAWLEEQGDGGEGADSGGYAALAVDRQGTAHVVYADWDNPRVKYVRDNTPPVAVADTFTTLVNTAVSGNVLANDSDPEGDPLRVRPEPVSGPNHGRLALTEAGDMTYTPEEGFHGPDTFTYVVSDDRGLSSTAGATIEVEVPVRIRPEPELEWWANEADGSRIALRLADARSVTWVGVLVRDRRSGQWETVKEQDGSGADAWHGTISDGRWEWWVPRHLLGSGPYRWVVYSRKGGYHLVYSEPFTMPTLTGRTLWMTGRIK